MEPVGTALVLAGGIPQIDLIKKLQDRGYEVVLADYTEEPPAAPYADEFVCASTLDIDAIRALAHAVSADLIITCCTDQALATVSLLSEELGLPCYISAEKGACVTNKQRMKRGMLEHGIPTARPLTLEECAMRDLAVEPVVIKPVDCNSSKGVVKVDEAASLDQAVQRAQELSRTGSIIIEEYIDGNEVSVDCFVHDGKGVVLCISQSEKVESGSGFVINRGFYLPGFHAENLERVQAIVDQIIDAFELEEGPLLVQMLDGPTGLSVIEFSARTGGCIKHRMIQRASGVDVIDLTIKASLGEEVEAFPVMSHKVIVNDFVYCRHCALGEVSGLDQCKESGWIDDHAVLKGVGSIVGGATNSGDRVAAITTESDSVADYERKFDAFSQCIDVFSVDGISVIDRDAFKGHLN